MGPIFMVLAGLTVGGAVAAVSLRNLVHCLLALVASFLGLAGLYLHLSATFVGLAQVLVYVGAVAILLVFAILLTRGGVSRSGGLTAGSSWVVGAGVALLVTGGLLGAVAWAPGASGRETAGPTVRAIGERLMTGYVLPLEAIALLLTAALIGAVLLAMPEPGSVRRHDTGVGPDEAP